MAALQDSDFWCLSCHLLAFLCPELLGAVVEQLLVHLHEEFQSIVDQPVDRPAHRQWLPQVTWFKDLVEKHRDRPEGRPGWWLTCSSGSWSCGREMGTWWVGSWQRCHWSGSWCTRCSSSTELVLLPSLGQFTAALHYKDIIRCGIEKKCVTVY